ncbi:hypothetical protein, partial [Nocardia brasiliensis]|uniref:hypothetical protein n=1 Tax=Nocardia brasiliensis TaxID=37326 RepID=UPI002456B7A5
MAAERVQQKSEMIAVYDAAGRGGGGGGRGAGERGGGRAAPAGGEVRARGGARVNRDRGPPPKKV